MAPQASSDVAPSPKHIVFFFMAATVAAVVVFLCGVLVGQNVTADQVRAVDPLPAGVPRGDYLIDDVPPPTLGAPTDEPSAAAQTGEHLTYSLRLDGPDRFDAPLDETFEEASDDPGRATGEVTSGQANASADTPVPPPPASDAATARASDDVAAADGYRVQVSAVRTQDSARSIAAGLSAKGYRVAIVTPDPNDPVPLYRVRVGPYQDAGEADRVRQRLASEEQFTSAFVTQ